MNSIELPIIGSGSQPKEADGLELDFLHLPGAMHTYSMPELSPSLSQSAIQAKALLQLILDALNTLDPAENYTFETFGLTLKDLAFLNETLGEGEVSIIHQGEASQTRIQESVLAGVWRVQSFNPAGEIQADVIEVGAIPQIVKDYTFNNAQRQLDINQHKLPAGLMNALPLVGELNAQIQTFNPETYAHVINLSLLPLTEQDLAFLHNLLGTGKVNILSRGYGTNRITSTATSKVWWVQYFNSDDKLILNTLEIDQVPKVACAAREDLADSASRLQEILDCC